MQGVPFQSQDAGCGRALHSAVPCSAFGGGGKKEIALFRHPADGIPGLKCMIWSIPLSTFSTAILQILVQRCLFRNTSDTEITVQVSQRICLGIAQSCTIFLVS